MNNSVRRNIGKVDNLETTLKNTVEQMLVMGYSYKQIVEYLKEKGEEISKMAICNYAKKFLATVSDNKKKRQSALQSQSPKSDTKMYLKSNFIVTDELFIYNSKLLLLEMLLEINSKQCYLNSMKPIILFMKEVYQMETKQILLYLRFLIQNNFIRSYKYEIGITGNGIQFLIG